MVVPCPREKSNSPGILKFLWKPRFFSVLQILFQLRCWRWEEIMNVKFDVTGMTCAACAARVEKAARSVPSGKCRGQSPGQHPAHGGAPIRRPLRR